MYIGFILGGFVLCASAITVPIVLSLNKTSDEIKNVNITTINVNKGVKNREFGVRGSTSHRPAFKKITKNGKEYFVMTKKQVS